MTSHRTRFSVLAAFGAALLIAGYASGTNKTASASAANASSKAELTLANSTYGKVIFSGTHRALYVFSADHGSTSTCYGECTKAWPPLLTAGTPTVGAGLNRALIGTTKRSDGTTQVTYNGHPLYYFSGDKGSEIKCQDANSNGGYWYVLSANGKPNTSKSETMTMHH